MNETPDSSLLQDYYRDGSQDAFGELVSRHADWVYSMAVRQVGQRQMAEDVTQGVFLALAQNGGRLGGRSVRGWLFKATRFVALTALRSEARRRKHERRAAMMNTLTDEIAQPSDWENIAPHLDEFIARLRKSEREAVLLRFFESKSMSEVGAALGVSEEAARKRIDRAVGKLRGTFREAGLVVPGAALAVMLTANVTHAAPALLKSSCASLSVSSSANSLAQGVRKMILRTQLKSAALAGLMIALMTSSLAAILLAQTARLSDLPATRPAGDAQRLPAAAGAPVVLNDQQQMDGWWADLAEGEPKCSRALLKFAAQPEKTVAFLQTRMLPLTISEDRVRGLIQQLGSKDEAVWKPAFDELCYFDPRLAIRLQPLMDMVPAEPARTRLFLILTDRPPAALNGVDMSNMTIGLRQLRGPTTMPQYNFFMQRGGRGGGSMWAESQIARLGHGPPNPPTAEKKYWTRAIRGIVLLDQLGTPDAIAILNQMATGNADALPTQVAKDVLAERH